MKKTITKVLQKLNEPTPQDFGVGVKKTDPTNLKKAYIVVNGPRRKQYTSEARERKLPASYATILSDSQMKGRSIFQEGVG